MYMSGIKASPMGLMSGTPDNRGPGDHAGLPRAVDDDGRPPDSGHHDHEGLADEQQQPCQVPCTQELRREVRRQHDEEAADEHARRELPGALRHAGPARLVLSGVGARDRRGYAGHSTGSFGAGRGARARAGRRGRAGAGVAAFSSRK